MSVWVYECMNVWMYECMTALMYEWMNEWMHACMHACMIACIYVCVCRIKQVYPRNAIGSTAYNIQCIDRWCFHNNLIKLWNCYMHFTIIDHFYQQHVWLFICYKLGGLFIFLIGNVVIDVPWVSIIFFGRWTRYCESYVLVRWWYPIFYHMIYHVIIVLLSVWYIKPIYWTISTVSISLSYPIQSHYCVFPLHPWISHVFQMKSIA